MDNLPSKNNSEETTSSTSLRSVLKLVSMIVLVFFLASVIGVYFYPKNKGSEVAVTTRVKKFKDVVKLSNVGEDPKPLQDFFVAKIKDKKTDDETRSAIYWITHRYFDNGGNIYEIYDFIHAHQELAFLNNAEAIYPLVFEKIKAREIKNFSLESLQALLAYYDVIDTQNLADITLWGLAANKYSELALISETLLNSKGEKLSKGEAIKFRGIMTERAMYYIKRSDEYLAGITVKNRSLDELLKTGKRDEDIVVALNQYGSAIENMKGIGFTSGHPFTPQEIYTFNSVLSREKVGRLYFFTHYLYATSLINAKEATKESVKDPLDKIVAYIKAEPLAFSAPHSSLARVAYSNMTKETSVYSPENARKLAKLHDGFKGWLLSNGWSESDFK